MRGLEGALKEGQRGPGRQKDRDVRPTWRPPVIFARPVMDANGPSFADGSIDHRRNVVGLGGSESVRCAFRVMLLADKSHGRTAFGCVSDREQRQILRL